MTTITGDQLRGHLDAMILASLEASESHGLGILQRLEEAGCGLLKLKEGSLYPALYRLEAAGLVESVAAAVPAGQKGAPRRVYRLTRKGKGSLAQERKQWREFVSVVGGILGVTPCLNPSPAS
ncbi:MAG: PadR family transcriptional regulator [Planctomycetaceae bacterium]